MPISGIALAVAPQSLEYVQAQIETEFHGEIHTEVENYLVVVLETETTRQTKQKFEAISRLPGVVSAWVAYHNTEDLEE